MGVGGITGKLGFDLLGIREGGGVKWAYWVWDVGWMWGKDNWESWA